MLEAKKAHFTLVNQVRDYIKGNNFFEQKVLQGKKIFGVRGIKFAEFRIVMQNSWIARS